MAILTSTEVKPLLNRNGKPMPLSDIAFTTDGKMMIKRPKKDVIQGAIRRTTSESTMEINFISKPALKPPLE